MDPDQTAHIGAVCSGSTLFDSILKSSVMLGIFLQPTTFSDAFFSFPFNLIWLARPINGYEIFASR